MRAFRGFTMLLLCGLWSFPRLAGSLAVAIAFGGAIFAGEGADATGGVNGLVESLSGSSSTFLGNVAVLAPLGFAFTAGVVATVNPCDFAMLPAYLGLYLRSDEKEAGQRALPQLSRAVVVGGVVTGGLVLLFGLAGIVISAGARFVVQVIPWVGLSIGILLAFVGSWLLGGGKLYTPAAAQAASKIGNPSEVSVRGYFMFGISYGTASLSCTLPIFLAVVGTTLATSGALTAFGQFILFGLGMGFVIMLLTLGMALFRGAMVRSLRKALPYIQPLSAGLMMIAGA